MLKSISFCSSLCRFEGVKERAEQLKRNYVVSAGTGTFFTSSWQLRGLEAFLMDIAMESPFMLKLLDRMLEYKLEIVSQYAQAGVDVISIGGDIAMHTRLFMEPDLWRKHFKWRDARLIEEARKHGVQHFYFHTDGNLMEVMEDLIEIGFTSSTLSSLNVWISMRLKKDLAIG